MTGCRASCALKTSNGGASSRLGGWLESWTCSRRVLGRVVDDYTLRFRYRPFKFFEF